MKKLKQRFKKLLVNKLDLPNDVILDLPRITSIGFYQIYIENYNSVIQFTDQFLHLKLRNHQLKIYGEGLVIRAILPEEIFIEGTIKEVHYLD